ncbi:MAG: ABC transporter ATP-binding protein, partial [Acidimicrobiia bacterium]|nr:ABC transporter ATP-binding protein [Acidimicrobiia bacterium]
MSQSQGIRRALQEAPMLRKGLGVTLIFAVVGSTAQVAIPVLIQYVIDTEIIGGSPDLGTVLVAGAVALLVVIVASAALRAALVRLARVSADGLSHLRVAVFGQLIRRALLGVQAERRGAMVSRVTSDITSIQEFTEWGGAAIVVYGAQILATMVAMFVYEWRLAVMISVGLTLYVLVLMWFQRILGRRHDQVRKVVAESLGVVSESVAAIPVIRAHGVEESTRHKVDRILEKRFRTEFHTARFGHMLFASAEIFSGLVTAGVLAVGLTMGRSWGMTAGTLLAFLFLVNLLIDPLLMLVEMLEPAQSAGAGLRRVTGALDTTSNTGDVDNPIELPPGSAEIVTHG